MSSRKIARKNVDILKLFNVKLADYKKFLALLKKKKIDPTEDQIKLRAELRSLKQLLRERKIELKGLKLVGHLNGLQLMIGNKS